jgi:hypothetical protein
MLLHFAEFSMHGNFDLPQHHHQLYSCLLQVGVRRTRGGMHVGMQKSSWCHLAAHLPGLQ